MEHSGRTFAWGLALGIALALSGCHGGGGTPDLSGPDGGGPTGPIDPGEGPAGASVVQRNKNASRDGHYIVPGLTRAAVMAMRTTPSFDVPLVGAVYAQPLYLPGGAGQQDLFFVATEDNRVYAVRADTGAVKWQKRLGDPVPLNRLPCGNIDPLGITGTPVIDRASRTIFVAAMTTPDGGATKQHLLFGLGADDGAARPGWPIDVGAKVQFQGQPFNTAYQNQRGGLALSRGVLYVPYGGHYGDCGDYHGWLVGVPVGADGSGGAPTGWATIARAGGAWAPGGVAADSAGVYMSTGNTEGADTWDGGEAILRFQAGPVFSGKPVDYFAPTNWQALDIGDVDIGSSGPLLLQVPGASPASCVLTMGKDGRAYVLDQANLGGIHDAMTSGPVSGQAIIGVPTAYQSAGGTYAALKGLGQGCPAGQSGHLTALKLSPAAPGGPPRVAVAWCAEQVGQGSPISSTVDGLQESLVWAIGSEGDSGLRAFHGETGALLYTGTAPDDMQMVRRFQSPIIARGLILVAADNRLWGFPAPGS